LKPAQTAPADQTPQSEPARNIHDLNLKNAVKTLEASYMKEAMKQARFNQKKAAKILGLSYHQFRGIYRKYGKNT